MKTAKLGGNQKLAARETSNGNNFSTTNLW
jgi:hypothetical protein